MTRLIFFIILIFLFAIGMVFASGIDGRWIGHIAGPEGDLDLIFNFEANSDTLTGYVDTMMGQLPIIPSKINENKFSFNVNVREMYVSHFCVLMGDSILMRYCMMEMDTLEVILKRE